MPNKLRSKLKENQFYCVGTRRRVTAHPDDIGVKIYKNKNIPGGAPALVAECEKTGNYLHKWIPHDKKKYYLNKYGRW